MKNPELKLPEKWRTKVEEYKPLLLAIARIILVIASFGGGASVMVGTANHEAESENVKLKAISTEERLEWLRQGVLQRVDVEEKEREEQITLLRERVAALEAEVRRLRR